jgi:hypothetical protein
MPLATIQVITPTGSFSTQHGEMYSFDYTMSDGMFGSANHKSVHSPFQVGQQVEYTVTGDFQGKPKLKVQKPQGGGQQAPQQRPQEQGYTQSAPRPQSPIQSQGNGPAPVHGATVGMGINQAIACLKEEQGTNLAEYLSTSDGASRLHTLASDIIRVALLLEKGKLADPVRVRENTQPQAAPPQPPPTPTPVSKPQRASGFPASNPTGQAFPTGPDDDGEDVPF